MERQDSDGGEQNKRIEVTQKIDILKNVEVRQRKVPRAAIARELYEKSIKYKAAASLFNKKVGMFLLRNSVAVYLKNKNKI